MDRTVPFTGDDLIGIGRAVNRITRRLKPFEEYSGSNVEGDVNQMTVEVMYEGELVGEVRLYDGWFGFFPVAVAG